MFRAEIYVERRNKLKEKVKDGILIFLGNNECPYNYSSNPYHFRQDSNYLYFWGLDEPGLFAIIDLDSSDEIIFGENRTIDDIIWMGPTRTIQEKAENVGVQKSAPTKDFFDYVSNAIKSGKKIHFLPQYRDDNKQVIAELLGIKPAEVNDKTSVEFIKAVISMRSVKSDEEITEIEKALTTSFYMYLYAYKKTRPGIREQEIAGGLEGIALSRGRGVSFPIIFSIHGEILHNHHHKNIMRAGDLALLDSGAESFMHYASDITRTFPVTGKFTTLQKEIYNTVLDAQLAAIEMIKPGIYYKDVHLKAATIITERMKDIGLMKGDIAEAVNSGAHALFFPHGLGHMMGLDVHDMEDLGENLVGYDEDQERSEQFGLAFLRLARKLQPGFVLTVEPGIYFIPKLIEQWKAENRLADFINYDKVEKMIGFGGIRIEDNVLVTYDGNKVLGHPIAKTVTEIEEICQNT